MKKFLVFVCLLTAFGGGAYLWLQHNAGQILTTQATRLSQRFATNPGALTIEASPITLAGWQRGKFAKVTISGKDVQLKQGPKLSSVKITLTDVEVAGPPYRLATVGNGTYTVSATDSALTDYLRTQGLRVSMARIPLDTATLTFSKAAGTKISTDVVLPIVNSRVPLTIHGALAPSGQPGGIDYVVRNVVVKKLKVNVADLNQAFNAVNPIINFRSWPVETSAEKIVTGDGYVTVSGKIQGVNATALGL